jgi:hypothetical protein
MVGLCWCISESCIWGSKYSGTNKVYKFHGCVETLTDDNDDDDNNRCTVPSDCTAICPQGG